MRCALTTFDNPFNPFSDFTQWFLCDEKKDTILPHISEELHEHLINYQKKKMIKKQRER